MSDTRDPLFPADELDDLIHLALTDPSSPVSFNPNAGDEADESDKGNEDADADEG